MRRVFIAAIALCLSAAAPVAPKLLLPLSDKDMMHVEESGCEFGFGPGNISYVYAVNQTILLRNGPGGGGAFTCRIPQKTMAAFQDKGGKLTCGDLELTMRKVGKSKASANIEADSSTWPAVLTVRNVLQKRQAVIRGTAGVAC